MSGACKPICKPTAQHRMARGITDGCLHTIFGGPDDCEQLCTSCRLDLCHHRGAASGPCRERLAGYHRHDNHYPLVGQLDCLLCCRPACLARVWCIASLSLSAAIDIRQFLLPARAVTLSQHDAPKITYNKRTISGWPRPIARSEDRVACENDPPSGGYSAHSEWREPHDWWVHGRWNSRASDR